MVLFGSLCVVVASFKATFIATFKVAIADGLLAVVVSIEWLNRLLLIRMFSKCSALLLLKKQERNDKEIARCC